MTHTINVPKDADEVEVRIVLAGTKVKSLSYVGPKSQSDDDVG